MQRRFNPHPPLLAGETQAQAYEEVIGEVSIHTRHYWRVKPPEGTKETRGMKFQSTPAITGG